MWEQILLVLIIRIEVVCDKEYENVRSDIISCDNKNVGCNIIKKIVYKDKVLGKHKQGIIEPIEPIMRPKYEGLGYMTYERNDCMDSIEFI